MNCRINPHGLFIWILIGDLLVHIKQVSISGTNRIFTQTPNSFCKIEINGNTGSSNSTTLINQFLCITGGHITWNKVTECRIFTFQEIITVFFFKVCSFYLSITNFLCKFGSFRSPNASVIPQ